jgi:hypothetical protein
MDKKMRVTMGCGFAPAPLDLLDDPRVTDPTTVAVYVALASFASYTSADCYPSLETIGKRAKCSDTTAWRHIQLLVELRYVKVTSGASRREPNTYHLVDPWGRRAPEPAEHFTGEVVHSAGETLSVSPVNEERDPLNETQERKRAAAEQRHVTDPFWSRFEKETGVKHVWKVQYRDQARKLWAAAGGRTDPDTADALVAATVEAYFRGAWWFTRARAGEGRHWDFASYYQHWNEIASSVRAGWAAKQASSSAPDAPTLMQLRGRRGA